MFYSEATNLVPGDTNGVADAFVHDRLTGTTERVSVDSAGTEADARSFSRQPSLSADGRFVTFHSLATNLVPGDTNGALDVFVHDRQTGITERVSVDSAGSEADRDSVEPSLNANGRFVAVASYATNLVPGDTNVTVDVFVHDRRTRKTVRVSVDSAGSEADAESSSERTPPISADGRFVAFYSLATNLVPGDTNAEYDVFVHDRQTGITERVSVNSAGTEADGFSRSPSLSADGRFVAFNSNATNLVPGDTNGAFDVFLRDRQLGITTRVSVSSEGAEVDGFVQSLSSVSADGRFVAFESLAGNLVPGDTNEAIDVFVHDQGPKKGRMTGGGSVIGSGLVGRVTHGFELQCAAHELPSNLEVNWSGNRFHLESLTSASCSDDPSIAPNPLGAGFDTYKGKGAGRFNGQPGATAEWTFTDNGEAGRNDTMTIEIKDRDNFLVLSVTGQLRSGNQQAHEK